MSNVTHREISPEEFVKELTEGYRLPCFGFKNVDGKVIQILKVDLPFKEGTALGLRAWVADGRGDAYVEVVSTEEGGNCSGCLLQEKDIYVFGDVEGSFVVFEKELTSLEHCDYIPTVRETSVKLLEEDLIGKNIKNPKTTEFIKVTGITRGKLGVGYTLESGELEVVNLNSGDPIYEVKETVKEITANPAWVGGGI